jgi:hypothetical protein
MVLFHPSQLGCIVSREDLNDIINDVFVRLLNEGEQDCQEFVVLNPDFNRMRDKSFLHDPVKAGKLQRAVDIFKTEVEKLLHTLDCYDRGFFNYFYGGMSGDDIVINRLPY